MEVCTPRQEVHPVWTATRMSPPNLLQMTAIKKCQAQMQQQAVGTIDMQADDNDD